MVQADSMMYPSAIGCDCVVCACAGRLHSERGCCGTVLWRRRAKAGWGRIHSRARKGDGLQHAPARRPGDHQPGCQAQSGPVRSPCPPCLASSTTSCLVQAYKLLVRRRQAIAKGLCLLIISPCLHSNRQLPCAPCSLAYAGRDQNRGTKSRPRCVERV